MSGRGNILVVGGAGYIGSHAAKGLMKAGFSPVVFDNLSRGNREALKWGEFVQGDLGDPEALDRLFKSRSIDAVMHFAAYALVGESVAKPGMYYRNNVASTVNLLEAMARAGCRNFIFSSTCAIYGEPERLPLTEDHPCRPINPYGRSKLMVEEILKDFEQAEGIRHVCLRYFNAAGADPDCETGERHDPETHLIPLAIEAVMEKRPPLSVFGEDYPTPDGTCLRDYIHVTDLSDAHLLALAHLLGGGGSKSFNLGNGDGYSVREVLDAVERAMGKPVPHRIVGRREGDPAVLVGSSDLIRRELKWSPNFQGIDVIVETAVRWHSKS